MLIIRFQRTGRRNSPFYRVVLQNKKDAIGSKALQILGSYNPHTKDAVLKKDEILKFVGNGAQVSNSIARLLVANGVKHNRIVFVEKAQKAPKKKAQEAATNKAKDAEEKLANKPAEVTETQATQDAAPEPEEKSKVDEPKTPAVEESSKEEKPAEEKAPEESQENNKEN